MSEIGEFDSIFSAIFSWGAQAVESAGRQAARTYRDHVNRQRVRERTTQFLERYEQTVNDLISQGLDRFVHHELGEIRDMIRQARSELASDPFAARSLSMEIGARIGPLPRVAREIRRRETDAERKAAEIVQRQARREAAEARRKEAEQRAAERQRLAEERQAAEKQRLEEQRRAEELRQMADQRVQVSINRLLQELTDPVERDFAIDGIRTVISQWESSGQSASDPLAVAQQLEQRLAEVHSEARRQAQQWKAQQCQEALHQSAEQLVNEQIIEAEQRLRQIDAERATTVLEQLKSLRQTVSRGGVDTQELAAILGQSEELVHEAVVDEECRRSVVRALIETLQQSGFAVDAPRRIREADKDVVLVYARKPAGQYASIQVTADGTMHYEFKGYEGMACKKDIDAMISLLRDVYNIPLSERRVIWQNPDRISKGQRPLPGTQEQSHG
ncbi:MAG: hypothetical protein KatS3mg110_0520 [Pirellulaceae bacterium]|nr:MAG: hypothetical protein KatS3mg110_0520 [Pirellulaceae bacterium]